MPLNIVLNLGKFQKTPMVLHNVCVKSMDFFDQYNQQVEENFDILNS